MQILLLTGTIKPNNDGKQKSIVLSDENFFVPEYRLKQYVATLLYYITQSNFDAIVFCENSNYEINNKQDIINIAKLYNKKIEFLQFEGDKDNIVKYGYGYGEAEIFDYAFENSKFLQEASSGRYKITGRYQIKNINELIDVYKYNELFFYKGWGLSQFSVTTAFFKMSNQFYKENLYKKYQIFYKKYYGYDQVFFPLESYWYFELRNVLLSTKLKVIKIPYYSFFSLRTYIFECSKKYMGLLGFGIIANILDKILYKQLYNNFTHK